MISTFQPKRVIPRLLKKGRDADARSGVIIEISGLKINELPPGVQITANHLFVIADKVTGQAYYVTDQQLKNHVSASLFKIVELTVGNAGAANPPGSPTPADGATDVIINFKVQPNSEIIFYQGIPVRLAPANDFNYSATYGATTTTYKFSAGLAAGFVLKFNIAIAS